jgi:hypothetical protein
LAAVAAVSVAVASSASSSTWQWGYNYMGSTVNPSISSPWNYYTSGWVYKNSGGEINAGWEPCGQYGSWSGQISGANNPSDFGCGGYLYTRAYYVTGNTSYLQFGAST